MAQLKINKIEKLKRSLRPFDFHRKLSALEPSQIGEAERFYLKNFGIYGHKLMPDRYILRVRIPGGRLDTSAFRRLFSDAEAAGAKLLATSRAQLELHGLTLGDAVRLSGRIESYGLTSWQTYTDNFRNIVTHPLDGIGEDAVIECLPLIGRMQEKFLKRPEFVGGIPRKFNTALIGNSKPLFSPFSNDLAFVLARHGGTAGFNVYAGGKNTETAKSLEIFIPPEDAVAIFEAVATLYRDEGPRESRSRARLYHMMERMGIEAFREAVLARFGKEVRDAGELWMEKGSPQKRLPLKNGGTALRYTTRFGELDKEMAEEVLALCDRHGIETLRLGCDQNLYLPGLPEDAAFLHETRRYAGVVACAGSKYCVYSLMDTKAESAGLGWEKCERLGIVIGFSGCLKGCARHAFSDIGLVGIRTKLFAEEVERGVRLYLGAEHTRGVAPGRLILYSVPIRRLGEMIDLLADLFEASGYATFEDFAADVLNRYSEPALAFWVLLNFYRRYVAKEGGLVIPEPAEHEDEKGYFLSLLDAKEQEIAEYLGCQEAFPFREAIIHLERACFRVKIG
jgi:ferredoxin-nitrite reductase